MTTLYIYKNARKQNVVNEIEQSRALEQRKTNIAFTYNYYDFGREEEKEKKNSTAIVQIYVS